LLGVVVAEIVILRRTQPQKLLLECAISALPAVFVVALYLIIARNAFGFWVTPPTYQQMLAVNLSNGINNFVSYAGYLVLITLPLPLALLYPVAPAARTPIEYAVAFLLLLAASCAGYFLLVDTGEMNFGLLDAYIDKRVANGALAVLSVIAAAGLVINVRRSPPGSEEHAYIDGLAAGVVLFILALSFTMPAQRYLIFVVPLFLLLILPRASSYRWIVAVAVLLSVALDLYITLNQVVSGTASVEMLRRIVDLGLLSKTSPEAIAPHVGGFFFPYRKDDKYFVVVAGDRSDKLASASSVFPLVPFISRTYSLVPLEQPQHSRAPTT
jgi:hypothetical protein